MSQVKPRSPAITGIMLFMYAIIRIIINVGYRMFYPFMPAIARGLGVSLSTVAYGLTLRSIIGVISPLLGSAADVIGHKSAMLIGMGLFVLGMVAIGIWSTYLMLIFALLMTGACKFLFDASIQAYIGNLGAYEQRGRDIGISEMGWSLSLIVGIPVVGWLIARSGWSTPFLWLAGLAIIGTLILWRTVQSDEIRTERPSLIRNFSMVSKNRTALLILLVVLFTALANETLVIIYAAWLENTYALRVVAVGAVTMLFGIAELGGEGLVATLTDRIGKQQAIAYGIVANIVGCALIILAGTRLLIAMSGLTLLFISFEFSFVSAISLVSELEKSARATLLAGNFSAHSVGRLIGTVLGPWLFSMNLNYNGLAAIFVNLVALAFLVASTHRQNR